VKYLATFNIKFEAFDDLAAREKFSEIQELTKIQEINDYFRNITSIKKKLQEIKDNNPPRSVKL